CNSSRHPGTLGRGGGCAKPPPLHLRLSWEREWLDNNTSLIKDGGGVICRQAEQLQLAQRAVARPLRGQTPLRLPNLSGRQALLRNLAHHVPNRDHAVDLRRLDTDPPEPITR